MIFTLYRFYTRTGRLLYVGQTVNPGGRFAAHRDEKTWWRHVARIEINRYDSKRALLNAEAVAIRNERPVYNIALNPTGGVPSVPCKYCAEPVFLNEDADPALTWWHTRCAEEYDHDREAGLIATCRQCGRDFERQGALKGDSAHLCADCEITLEGTGG